MGQQTLVFAQPVEKCDTFPNITTHLAYSTPVTVTRAPTQRPCCYLVGRRSQLSDMREIGTLRSSGRRISLLELAGRWAACSVRQLASCTLPLTGLPRPATPSEGSHTWTRCTPAQLHITIWMTCKADPIGDIVIRIGSPFSILGGQRAKQGVRPTSLTYDSSRAPRQ